MFRSQTLRALRGCSFSDIDSVTQQQNELCGLRNVAPSKRVINRHQRDADIRSKISLYMYVYSLYLVLLLMTYLSKKRKHLQTYQ